jgi:hypothetical protein
VSVTETVLIFVGVPLGLFLLAAFAVYGASAVGQPRYRPGRPWEHEPVWYLPAPDSVLVPALHGHGHTPAIEAPSSVLDAPARTAVGGATGEW